jgi:hypothetical protein
MISWSAPTFPLVVILAVKHRPRSSYEYDSSSGAPKRRCITRECWSPALYAEVARLEPDQWVRVRYNGRWSGYHAWECAVQTWNVGVWTEFRADAFLETEPLRVYEQMALLR